MHASMGTRRGHVVPQGLPAPAEAVLAVLAATEDGALADLLASFVASFVREGWLCALGELEGAPEPVRAVALAFFEHCLGEGLSLEEQSVMSRWLEPYLDPGLRVGRLH